MGREDDHTIEPGADLSFAYLTNTNLTDTDLRGANLAGATMPNGSVHD